MKNPLEMTIDELTAHIDRRKAVIAKETAKPRWQRDEKYILYLIQKQRMWIAIRAGKQQQPPLF